MENINANTKDFKYYVYEHYLDGELFYIGKGTNGRALEIVGRNYLWEAKVNGRESEIKVKIIATFEDSDHAELFEKAHIKQSIELGENLTNVVHNASMDFKTSPNVLKRIRLQNLFVNNNYQAKDIKYIIHINQIENIIDDFKEDFPNGKYKGMIYTETVESMNNAKEILINKGYNPLVIWSTTNIYNNMNNKQMKAKNELINTGKIPEPYDFLIFNSHLFAKIKMKDENIKLLIINSTTEEIQQYVKGFVGQDVDLLVYRTNDRKLKSSIDVPEHYIDKNLTTKMKQDLCDELNIIGIKGTPIKWTTMRKQLVENGYNIRDTQVRIDKKATKVSIITK